MGASVRAFVWDFGLENYFILPFVNFEVHGGLFQNFEPNQFFILFQYSTYRSHKSLFNVKTICDLGKGDVL